MTGFKFIEVLYLLKGIIKSGFVGNIDSVMLSKKNKMRFLCLIFGFFLVGQIFQIL